MALLASLPVTVPEDASFGLGLLELVEEAYERAGVELRTGYQLKTARRSLHLLFADWANRGINLWTLERSIQTLTPGGVHYSLPADTVDVLEAVIRTGHDTPEQQDRLVHRMSASEYVQIPNKLEEGGPRRVWYNRLTQYPVATFWPVPDQAYKFVMWRLRRIEDVDTVDEAPEVPFRFLPALVAGLAFYLAQKVPEGSSRLQFLKSEYEQAWQDASYEDREKNSMFVRPRGYRI